MLPISNSEDDDGPSCVRVPVRGLPPALAGAAWASLQAPSSAFLLTRRGQTQHTPPSAQATHPTGLLFLPSRLHAFAECETCSGTCTPLV